MDKNLIAQVEKLVEWRCSDPALAGKTVDEVMESLQRGRLTTGTLPVPQEALHSFRNRRNTDKRKLIKKAQARLAQTALPQVSATPPAGVPEALVSAPPIAPLVSPQKRNEALADVARLSALELKDESGSIFITLRSFERLIGKRPDHLSRTLVARGFPLQNIQMRNERGEMRDTPAIHIDYIFAVVGLADLHGMNPGERNQLFTLQRELPLWMKRFHQLTDVQQPAAPSKDETRLFPLADRIISTLSGLLSKIADRFDVRFDRLEQLINPAAPPPTVGASTGKLPRLHTRVTTPPPVFRVSGSSKMSLRPPLKDLDFVVKEVNKFSGKQYSASAVLHRAEALGIFEAPLWGADKVGEENGIVLDGHVVTWWFDEDAIDHLKEDIRKESVAVNGALS